MLITHKAAFKQPADIFKSEIQYSNYVSLFDPIMCFMYYLGAVFVWKPRKIQ